MVKKLISILKLIIVVLLSIVLILNLFVLYDHYINHNDQPSIFGYTTAIVVSGSMVPVLNINDLIIVKDSTEYNIGDVIMFKDGDSYVTHRIVEINNDLYTTKGDANNAIDANQISLSQIKGKLVSTLAGFGAVIGFVKSPLGMLIIIVALIIIILIPTRGSEKNEEE